MKPSIQLRLGQHLTMTPQLQQAIRLLQLSTLELSQEIQEALESNLMLELEEGQEQAPLNGEESLQALEAAMPTGRISTTSLSPAPRPPAATNNPISSPAKAGTRRCRTTCAGSSTSPLSTRRTGRSPM